MIIKAILWGAVGAVAGGCLGAMFMEWLGGIILGLGLGVTVFISSYRNDGKPPKWLWRSKSDKNQKKAN